MADPIDTDEVSLEEGLSDDIIQIQHPDGSVTIDLSGDGSSLEDDDEDESDHDANLADKIDPIERSRIAAELIQAIDADKSDRAQWVQMRAKAIELLGLKIEGGKSDVSTSSAGIATSSVRDTTLLDSCLRFQANAYAELCPAAGPVKVVNWGTKNEYFDNLAEDLEEDLNYFFTTTASEYYPDTRRMLFFTGLSSGTFKKVYRCPLRRRPVSEYVDGSDLIIPPSVTDLKNAGRITHEVTMRRSVVRRMQIAKVYRDVALGTDPLQTPANAVKAKEANVSGLTATAQRPEDQEFTIYECYCELDIKGHEHKENGKASGLPLPYRVTIEAGTQEILEIRRNWDEDDEDQKARIPFILFPYATGLSIYGMGLGQILGNSAMALTALTRIAIDAGMFGNYPGGLKIKGAGRQTNNEIRVPPGGFAEIDTGDKPIQQAVMAMPYKDISPSLIALMEQLRNVAAKLGNTADIPVGEGKQDAPVGTTIALLEQATKIESSVHKALHAAQAEEFELIVELLRDDPEALWRGNRRPALGSAQAERVTKLKEALENLEITPKADPNVPSHIHRISKAQALMQVADKIAMAMGITDKTLKAYRQVIEMIGYDDPNEYVPDQPPQAASPQQDPKAQAAMAQLQLKQQDMAARMQMEQVKAQSKEKQLQLQARDQDLKHMNNVLNFHSKTEDRKSKEDVAMIQTAKELIQAAAVHPETENMVDDQLAQWLPYFHADASGNLQ